ncbi:MAG TPA: type II toxin-antitoxin system HicA family toxin [Thermoanaerobaculia bacterium]|nr:type II toxin-antitoxin system HicA family toxin [Thermoanaerobaculia bacterium]
MSPASSSCRLSSLGFQVIRTRGSLHFVRHLGGRATVVPVHAGETIGPGLLSRILRDCDISKATSRRLYRIPSPGVGKGR